MKELYVSNDLIYNTISEACGSDVLPLVHYIKLKENVSETEISENLEIPINMLRNMFYRLLNFNLVRFTKKKDKKKGWYIYYWTFLARNIPYAILAMKKKKLEGLKSRIEREESNTYFICNENHFKLDFDGATEFDFKCPECGELIYQIDNLKIIDDLNKDIDELDDYIQHPPSIFNFEEEPIDKLEIVTDEDDDKKRLTTTKKAKKAAKKATKKVTKKVIKKPAKKITKKTIKRPVKKEVKKPVKKVTKKIVKKSLRKAVGAVKKMVKKAIKKVTKKPVKKVTKKLAKKITKKTIKRPTKKITKKATKQTSKKIAKKATKKVSKKSAKKTVLSNRKKKSLAKNVLSKRRKK